jgi:hypothetical protein
VVSSCKGKFIVGLALACGRDRLLWIRIHNYARGCYGRDLNKLLVEATVAQANAIMMEPPAKALSAASF